MHITIIDLGSQYTHLISKRLRLLGYKSTIVDQDVSIDNLRCGRGVIISGGPGCDTDIFDRKLNKLTQPILGVCLGHQIISKYYGGTVESTTDTEFGKATLSLTSPSDLWTNVPEHSQIWMSHFDTVTTLPTGFDVIGKTSDGVIAAMQHNEDPVYTLQFHPEVVDTEFGYHILENFARICQLEPASDLDNFSLDTVDNIKNQVRNRNVLLFLSGGVDSTVAFELLNASLGNHRVLGLFVDNGFMRKDEAKKIKQRYDSLGYTNVKYRDYSSEFLLAIGGLTDPEQKRQAVGETFLRVREKFIEELDLNPEEWMLGQGTLYPDIIESGGTRNSKVIKSHHNRATGVQELLNKGLVVEPLKELYKDEVRKLGEKLGLPKDIVHRHPFPGPGLSINVLCLDEATEMTSWDRLPINSVGVQGDNRTYRQPVVIELERDWDVLEAKSIQITNQSSDANRVVVYLPSHHHTTMPQWYGKSSYCSAYRLALLREADNIITEELIANDLMDDIFQLLTILIPVSTSGFEESIVIRPVCSQDVMTAKFARIDWPILDRITQKLYDLIGIDSVFYDVTHKPPGTFGWE